MDKGLAISLFAALSLGACDSPKPQPVTPPSATAASPNPSAPVPALPASAAATPTVPVHMQEHFAKALEMKAALIKGDLARFKEVSAWMAEHELAKSPPGTWKTHIDAMQSCAKTGRDAKDLKAAAVAVAQVGRTCAECHTALGGPKVEVGAPPAEGSGAAPHMARHQWAADRMWVKGAEAMADAPLTPGEAAPKKSVSPKVEAEAKRVHDQAQKARTIAKPDREAAYAELVTTCAKCHEMAK
jgi:hypothetical protein